jgi:chitinase
VQAHFDVSLHVDPQIFDCQAESPNCAAKDFDVCVEFTTLPATGEPGTATPNHDFRVTSGTLKSTVHVTSAEAENPVGSIAVDVFGDTEDEPDETFKGKLSLTTDCEPGVVVDGAEAVMTILDDDGGAAPAGPAEVAVNDVTIREGDEGGRKVAFTISLSRPVLGIVSVSYRTANGSATAGATGDYLATLGSVTFKRFATSQHVDVTVRGDSANEPNETFNVELVKATGATIVDGTGTGTIVDDD